MAYTTQQLIVDAWYLSGIVARDLETVGGSQIDDGLYRLNGFLAIKSANMGMIPYYQVVNDNFIAGQEKYFIPNLIHIESLTFFLDQPNSGAPVRFSMEEVTRQQYFATGRIENIKTLPYQWHLERVYGGSNLYIYYPPQENYAYELVGKYNLDQTVLNQDLSLFYDRYYIEYLTYGLAQYLCEFYNVLPPPSVLKQLMDFENNIRDTSPMDLTMRKLEYFPSQSSITYAQANIGGGFTRP
jgi:hypothetical protein